MVARNASPGALLDGPTVPAGLPSDMLERRPDVRQIEKALAAASLRIDRARADYFPSVSLTGALGTESAALSNLFSGPASIWSLGAGLLQPLLEPQHDRRERAGGDARRREELVVNYRQTVQAAFKDVHDALAADRTTREALAAQTERSANLQQAYDLSDIRYKAGYSPYLEVLDAQRQLLQAQTLQILAARDVRLALVDLAKALGGGWEYETAVEPRRRRRASRVGWTRRRRTRGKWLERKWSLTLRMQSDPIYCSCGFFSSALRSTDRTVTFLTLPSRSSVSGTSVPAAPRCQTLR